MDYIKKRVTDNYVYEGTNKDLMFFYWDKTKKRDTSKWIIDKYYGIVFINSKIMNKKTIFDAIYHINKISQ